MKMTNFAILWSQDYYTLRSVTMSGHVKYKRSSLACKMQEYSACNTSAKSMVSGHLKIKKGLVLYLYWSIGVTLLRVYHHKSRKSTL